MALRLTIAARNAAAGDGTNAGLRAYIGATPILKIFTGAQPAAVADNPAGTQLSEHTLAAFGAASSGVITSVNATSDDTALDTGVAGCWALYQSNGTTKVCDGTVGEGSGDISFDETSIILGGTVKMGNLAITVPS